MAVNSAKKQRGKPFPKGTSGNPAGKPPGAKNRTTLAAQSLLDGEAESLTRKCVDLALTGDTAALRLCMERLVPPRKERPIELPLSTPKTAEEVSAALAQVIAAVAEGTITPGEGQSLAGLLELQRRSIEDADLESRIKRLEETIRVGERR